nr:MAG TPA: hypothetical protein [Caudoviricetes sp.]
MLRYVNINRGIQIEIIRCRDNCFLTVASTYSLINFREIIFLRKTVESLFRGIENICDNLVTKNNIYILFVHILALNRDASRAKVIINSFYLSSCFFCLQRYKEFLKLPNKMHFNYVFRCIFNVCFICKENSDTLFAFVAYQGIGPRGVGIAWQSESLLPVVGEFRLLLSSRTAGSLFVKLKHADASAVKHLNL